LTARAHWKKTLATEMTSTDAGALPSATKRSRRAGGNACRAVDPQHFADARDQEHQRDMRVVEEVVQAVDALVAATIRQEQRLVIRDGHEARGVPARRGVQPMRPACGQDGEGRGLDVRPVKRMQVVAHLGQRSLSRPLVIGGAQRRLAGEVVGAVGRKCGQG
jgi:hypothetical protein